MANTAVGMRQVGALAGRHGLRQPRVAPIQIHFIPLAERQKICRRLREPLLRLEDEEQGVPPAKFYMRKLLH